MTEIRVPFYGNTEDNTHCFQAAVRMVLKFFKPEEEYSWEELERMTAKIEGQWTWPIAVMIWLSKNGFDVQDVELFDYQKFSIHGKVYLQDMFGLEIAEAQDKHTNLKQEQELSKELVTCVEVQMRVPTVINLRNYLEEGYLLICNINAAKLDDVDGYLPHVVVVFGHENGTLLLHNPGLPPNENQRVSVDRFEKAWAYPEESGKNMLAVRLT